MTGYAAPSRFWGMHLIRTSILTSGLSALVFVAASAAVYSEPAAVPAANVTTQRLLHADSEPAQWMTYGGDYNEQRYSRLTKINPDNVKQLGLKWFADYDTNLSQDGTPLFIDGVLYVSTAWSRVYAFEAASGKKLWEYDPRHRASGSGMSAAESRTAAIAAYNGKIYLGTLDGRLVAINARDGTEVWSTLTVDQSKHYSITSAPRVAKGKVFIGESGGEYGVRGYISAYDAESGKLDWRFYTVPGNPADGFENAA